MTWGRGRNIHILNLLMDLEPAVDDGLVITAGTLQSDSFALVYTLLLHLDRDLVVLGDGDHLVGLSLLILVSLVQVHGQIDHEHDTHSGEHRNVLGVDVALDGLGEVGQDVIRNGIGRVRVGHHQEETHYSLSIHKGYDDEGTLD